MDFITWGIFLLKVSFLDKYLLNYNFMHWQNKKRLLQGVLVGLTLRLFYHMKMTFEKEMFLLNGVIIDLCLDIHRRRNSVVRRTNCTSYD